MWRILTDDGALFVSVDIGGEPTPDEPTVFSTNSLGALLRERFEIAALTDAQAQSQARTDEALRQLAEAQAHSDRRLDALIDVVRGGHDGQSQP
jgi:hypothetical protein